MCSDFWYYSIGTSCINMVQLSSKGNVRMCPKCVLHAFQMHRTHVPDTFRMYSGRVPNEAWYSRTSRCSCINETSWACSMTLEMSV